MEGISQEAISLAGHLKLGRLIVLFDDNQISIDGPTSLSVSDDQIERFRASGWHTAKVDGHDPQAVALAIENARAVTDRPVAHRLPHHHRLWRAEASRAPPRPMARRSARTRSRARASGSAGVMRPSRCRSRSSRAGARQGPVTPRPTSAGRKRGKRLDAQRPQAPDRSDRRRRFARKIAAAVTALKADFSRDAAKLATRQSSQKVLEKLLPVVPGLIGGSADLTGSNGTLTKLHTIVKPGDFSGNYIHYGVREHGMAAAMNGLALHGGIVPYGGTFLVFSDYCRPSIRLSALMGKRVIYVMTHDSIGLGEDGPTHQPVEHLAALRAMPNLNVFRPADSVECAECWEIALGTEATPSILALTRQGLPLLRTAHTEENLSSQGRLCADRAKGPPRRHPDRHRLRGVARRHRRQGPARGGDRSRRGVDALLGVVRGPRSRLSGRRSGHRSPRGRRGGGRVRMAEMAWTARAFSSACVDLGLQLRARSFISTSESRQWQSRPRPAT